MTRQFKKLAHSLYECKHHIVFCPKYRYKILQDEVGQYVKQQIYRLSNQARQIIRLISNNAPSRCNILKPPPLAVVIYFLYSQKIL